MELLVICPIYVSLWILAVHIQYLMRNEKKQDKFLIYPVFMLIGLSFTMMMFFLLH